MKDNLNKKLSKKTDEILLKSKVKPQYKKTNTTKEVKNISTDLNNPTINRNITNSSNKIIDMSAVPSINNQVIDMNAVPSIKNQMNQLPQNQLIQNNFSNNRNSYNKKININSNNVIHNLNNNLKSNLNAGSSLNNCIEEDDDIINKNTNKSNNKDTPTPSKLTTIKDKVHLSMKLKYKQIKANNTSQTYPMLVTLTADEIENSKTSMDLVCVLDVSGSMQGMKIQLLKQTFPILLDLLNENDRLSIVIFNSSSKKITPLLRMDSKGKEITLNRVNSINASGGTNIGNGMKLAFDILHSRKKVNEVTGIFLLSDGICEKDAYFTVNQLFKNTNDCSINTFGFGSDHDPILMSSIAAIKDGNFYFVEELNKVDESFGDCLIGLQSVLAKNIEFAIKPIDSVVFKGVKIVDAYGTDGTWQKNNGTYLTSMKQLFSGKSRNFVLEIEIPKANVDSNLLNDIPSVIIANAEVTMTGLIETGEENMKLSSDLSVDLYNNKKEISDGEENKDVMFNFYRIKFAMLMETCKQYSDKGNYDQAQKLLSDYFNVVSSSKLNDNRTLNLQRDIKLSIQNNSPDTYKVSGHHYMVQNVNCFSNERSNNCNNMNFMNNNQKVYNSKRIEVKSLKKNK